MIGEGQLETVLAPGRVDQRSIRLWARDKHPGPHTLEIVGEGELPRRVSVDLDRAEADHTAAWTYPDDFEGHADLRAGTRYRARLLRDGACLETARFMTEPAQPPPHFSFAAFSCHQPFSEDESVYAGVHGMLTTAYRSLEQADARFCLCMGDQIYADYPESQSLFDQDYFAQIAPPGRDDILQCSREEVRRIYQHRHRRFWSLEEFVRIQSDFPCYLILDDHEIVDNFGTDPEHATGKWENLRQGALDAFYDFQGARVVLPTAAGGRPKELYFRFNYGCVAGFVMDIRSERRTVDDKTTPYSREQLEALLGFLRDSADARIVVLVTSVPLVHLEAWAAELAGNFLARGSDVHERWSHPSCIEHRDELIKHLHAHALEHPRQTIAFLGGDIHTGAGFELCFPSGVRLYQLTSSAISNKESKLRSKVFEMAPKAVSELDFGDGLEARVRLIDGIDGHTRNPFGGLNIGLLDVEDNGEQATLRFRLITDRDGEPETVFCSERFGPCLPGVAKGV